MRRAAGALRWFVWNLARLASYGMFRRGFETAITEWAPDIVHAHDTMALPAAARAARASGARLVFDSHELETHRNPPQLWINRRQTRAVEARYLPQADRVITVGERIADHLVQDYAIARPAVIFNSPAQDPRPLPARWQSPARRDVRAETGLHEGAVLMVYTGNIAANRGIEQTIEGLAQYQCDHPDAAPVHLSAVGRGSPGTLAALGALADRCGVAGQVRFHDPVAANDVTRFIATATLAVIPIIPETLSYQYAMPNKLFEALLADLPILGADLAEMGPFIRAHDLGQSYDSRQAQAFSAALTRLLARPPGTPDARAALKARYSWEGQSQTLLAIYRGLTD